MAPFFVLNKAHGDHPLVENNLCPKYVHNVSASPSSARRKLHEHSKPHKLSLEEDYTSTLLKCCSLVHVSNSSMKYHLILLDNFLTFMYLKFDRNVFTTNSTEIYKM